MKKKYYLIFLFFLLICDATICVEIEDGKLYLDIEIIANAQQIHLKCPDNFFISEEDSPFRIDFSNTEITIELTQEMNPEHFWRVGIKRFNNKNEAVFFQENFPESVIEESSVLAYNNNVIQKENIYNVYLGNEFKNYEEAKSNKEVDSWIQEKYRFPTSELIIYDIVNNRQYFLNAPLVIHSNKHITVFDVPKANFWKPVNLISRTYEGDLKVKLNQIGKLNLIANVELDHYIAGVLPNEIGRNVPFETLKAQAIAARSEALFKIMQGVHKDDNFDLCASIHCQVFSGVTDLSEEIRNAVIKTSYSVALYDAKIINAVYSTCCGGITESSQNIWGGNFVPYLLPVYDGKIKKNIDLSQESAAFNWINGEQPVFCNMSHKTGWRKNAYKWGKQYQIKEFEEILNSTLELGELEDIEILERDKSGRILKLKLSGSKNNPVINNELQIRQYLGGLPSTFFIVDMNGECVSFKGKGSGHGVGMCQLGAIQMGKEGYTAAEILKHYYPKVEIRRITVGE